MGLFECSKVLDSSRAEFPARRIVSRRGRGEEKGVLAEIWKSKSFDSGGFHSPWTRSSFNVVSKIRNLGKEDTRCFAAISTETISFDLFGKGFVFFCRGLIGGFCRVNDTRAEEKGDGMGGPVMDFAGVDGRRC